MTYCVIFDKRVLKDFDLLPVGECDRIHDVLLAIADDPRSAGCQKMRGFVDVYRIRMGSYRLVYQIMETDKIVRVFRVGHRKDVYRNL
ncbi:MAG: type II toxin-antitoxin system RelE/ParE family toxin [Candidatus Omnitrophica bacterium]|nr:type II toxin-antitoxin system RelE/ParE family toxin [Candidatus Omnitrophota bacterium]